MYGLYLTFHLFQCPGLKIETQMQPASTLTYLSSISLFPSYHVWTPQASVQGFSAPCKWVGCTIPMSGEGCIGLGRNSEPLGREFWDSRKQQYGRKVDCRRETISKGQPPPESWGTPQGKTKQNSQVGSGWRLLPAPALAWWQSSCGLKCCKLWYVHALWRLVFRDFETLWKYICYYIPREERAWTIKVAC